MPATDPRPSTRGKAKKDRRNATTLKRIESAKRTEGILQLRRQGWSLAKIGDVYKIDHSRVWQIITEALDKSLYENVDQVRKLELERLDELQAAWYKKAIDGDPVALDKVRALLADRARLLGLNAPVKIENTGKDGGPMDHRVIEDAAAIFDGRIALRLQAREEQRAAEQAALEAKTIEAKPPEAETK